MGIMDDVNRAMYSAVPRKIELARPITIQKLTEMLRQSGY